MSATANKAELETGWSVWPAPAKLNLFLRILGRREDGYHRLQTVFQLLDWCDSVHVLLREDGQIIRRGGDTSHFPECDDLLIKAAKMLRSSAKCAQGAEIFVTKRIPVGGGFGGGSSDAATVLSVLNLLWGAGLDAAHLSTLGLALGADVPLFLAGQNAWAEGIGERLIPLQLPPSWYLVVDPGVSVPTGELFQAPELTRDAAPATIADFVSGLVLGNAFEPVLRRRQPAVDAVFEVLSSFGQASLTGTGSGCFVRFRSQEAALAAQSGLPGNLRSWVLVGADRSPLLEAVAAWKQT
ncbi:MAG: 4-(cytidine 5'-diphospho)-2-C-methyl-D-erythritol kinase [Arenimonas sp.]